MADDWLVALKAGGAALIGSAIALKGIPGTRGQRLVALLCSLGMGYIAGAVALERYAVTAGGGYHLLAIWAGSVFGLVATSNVMQQVPEIIKLLRDKWIGKTQDASDR